MTLSGKYLVLTLVVLVMLPLVSATKATITVIDKEGDAIKGAAVTITYSNDTVVDSDCNGDTTSNKGEIECDLYDDEDYEIAVTHDDYKDFSNTKALKNWDKGDTEIAVVMRPEEFSLEITVEDEKGDGVKSASVAVESLDKELDSADFDSGFDIVALPDSTTYDAFEYDESDDTNSDGIVTFDDLEYNTDYKITIEKSTYITTVVNFTFQDDASDDDVTIELVKPGTATYTAIVKDSAGRAVQGATVQIVGTDSAHSYTLTTNANGEAVFTVYSPETYDLAVSKTGYSGDHDDDWSATNNGQKTKTFTITSQNTPPVANAGPDRYALVGQTVTLNATGSSDPDGDALTYTWTDSLGTQISSVVAPTVTFDVAGTHTITLTVSDGKANSTDAVIVTIESSQNCGDSVCSLAERTIGNCPQDCPVCEDTVCGAGEADTNMPEYCPVDCGIGAKVILSNVSALVAGNSTTISLADPTTGAAVTDNVVIEVTSPNGTVTAPEVFMGRATVSFPTSGRYTIEAGANKYATTTQTVDVRSPSNMDWLVWAVIIVLIIAVVYLVVRYMGTGGGKGGYRATKFRRRKPTLSSV